MFSFICRKNLVVPSLKAPTKIEDFDASMFSFICKKNSTDRELY
jgi:hypothetical protein